MRSFIAIELDDAIRGELARFVTHELAKFGTREMPRCVWTPSPDHSLEGRGVPPRGGGVRWCTVHQLHVTLKFLDQVPDAQLPRIAKIIADAADGIAPFSIDVAGLGAFPSRSAPRVLWVGVNDPSEACARWLSAADPALGELGIPMERRRLKPHVTLGRSRDAAGVRLLSSVLGSDLACSSGTMTVERLTLFESVAGSGGSVYRPLATIPLRAT